MGWFSRKPPVEKRNYSSIILDAVEGAVSTATGAGHSAGIEMAAAFLANELRGATVEGDAWLRRTITRAWLADHAAECLRTGEAVAFISVADDGEVNLIPVADNIWHGDSFSERDWTATCTVSVPDGAKTITVPRSQLIVSRWSSSPIMRHLGRSSQSRVSTMAAAASRGEARIAESFSGAVASLLTIPAGASGDGAALARLRAAIASAKGRSLVVEGAVQGFEQKTGSRTDWQPTRVQPDPTGLLAGEKQAREALIGAAGFPAALFDPTTDGTGAREALRRARVNVIEPFSLELADELSRGLATDVALKLSPYATDVQGKATSAAKLAAAGLPLDDALDIVGIEDGK